MDTLCGGGGGWGGDEGRNLTWTGFWGSTSICKIVFWSGRGLFSSSYAAILFRQIFFGILPKILISSKFPQNIFAVSFNFSHMVVKISSKFFAASFQVTQICLKFAYKIYLKHPQYFPKIISKIFIKSPRYFQNIVVVTKKSSMCQIIHFSFYCINGSIEGRRND